MNPCPGRRSEILWPVFACLGWHSRGLVNWSTRARGTLWMLVMHPKRNKNFDPGPAVTGGSGDRVVLTVSAPTEKVEITPGIQLSKA